MAVLLLSVGVYFLTKGLSRKSRLLRPDALLIDPDNPDHLLGRQMEIRRFSEAVAARPVVFLVGESGAGKSALVRAGLIPALRRANAETGAAPTMLPIYVNTYGSDWDNGLRERLVDAAWHGLGDELRSTLRINTRDGLGRRLLSPAVKTGLFPVIRNRLGLMPLLIFDQFDDYQVAHREIFLPDDRWINSSELVAQNALWKQIGALVQRGVLHLFVVTRREVSQGLEAVRFEDPDNRVLERVKSGNMTALLDQLTRPGADGTEVIGSPEKGWEALKRRLIHDLTDHGRILPIQARIAFSGLADLPYLSISAYEEQGGINGLEAGYIKDAMSSAAQVAGVDEAQVLAVLMKLVDHSDPELPKARTADTSTLSEAARAEPDLLDQMITVLRREGVVRSHIREEPGNADASWSLYHDYLCNAVLSAHRRADRWQQMLNNRLRTLNEADDWRSWWRALLSPLEQIRLIMPTLRGKVRWTGYSRFALASTIRLLPLIAVLGIASIAGYQALQWQARQEARRILTAIVNASEEDMLGSNAYPELWSLAASAPRLRRAFVEASIRDRHSHAALIKHLQPVAQSIFGFDTSGAFRRWTLERLLSADADTAFPGLLAAKTRLSAPDVIKGVESYPVEVIVKSMAATKNADLLPNLRTGLRELSKGLTADQTAAAANRLLQILANNTDPNLLIGIGTGLAGLGDNLSADRAQAVAKGLVEAMNSTENPDDLSRFSEGLAGLGEKLHKEEAKAAANRLVEFMAKNKTNDAEHLRRLGRGLGALGEQLPNDIAKKGARRLVGALAVAKEPEQITRLLEGLVALGEKLPPDLAAAAADRLVDAVAKASDTAQLASLGGDLLGLGNKLPAKQAAAVAIRLTEYMKAIATTSPYRLADLGACLETLKEDLPADGAVRLAEARDASENPCRLNQLLDEIARLGDKLPADQTAAVVDRLAEAMAAAREPYLLGGLGAGLGILVEYLPHQLAAVGAKRLTDAMAATRDPNQREWLAWGLDRLSNKLPDNLVADAKRLLEEVNAATDRDRTGEVDAGSGLRGKEIPVERAEALGIQLLGAMAAVEDPANINQYLEDRYKFSEKLSNEQVAAVARRLVEAMGATKNPYLLGGLAAGLGLLGQKLSADQASAGARHLTEAMAAMNDQRHLNWVAWGLGRLGKKLPARQATMAAERLVEVLAKTKNPYKLSKLVAGLGWLSEHVHDAQAAAGAARLVDAMPETANDFQLKELGTRLGGLGAKLPDDQAAAGAERLLTAMENSQDAQRLDELSEGLVALGNKLPTNKATMGAERLVKFMEDNRDHASFSWLGPRLGKLGKRLPAGQAAAFATRLTEATRALNDPEVLVGLGESFVGFVDKIPPDQTAAVAMRLADAMLETDDPSSFVSLAETLASLVAPERDEDPAVERTSIQVAPSSAAMGTALDLLQAPLSVEETRAHLLTYYGRLAGRRFKTTDSFIEWARASSTDLDLTRPPRSPFR